MIEVRDYIEPQISKKEILRYAGCKPADGEVNNEIEALMENCLEEVLPKLSYRVCYITLPVNLEADICDFGCFRVESANLAKNLDGCHKVILFAATIGVEIDRLIARYGRISPAKAVLLQAIGAERIESLCDIFVEEMRQKENTKVLHPRFSPGYGDLPLEVQKDIFQVLNCGKHIGLSLNDSMLMSPSKSVTAFIGMKERDGEGCKSFVDKEKHACELCSKGNCAYRV